MTPQYIDVPAEACPRTLAASQSIRQWLRDELQRKLEPTRPGKRANRIFNPHAGLIPAPPKQRARCKVIGPDGSVCGRKAQARELCPTHYDRWRNGREMNLTEIKPNRRADVTNEMLLAMLQSGMSLRAVARKVGMAYGSVRERLSPKDGASNLSDWSGSVNVKLELESTYAADPRVTPSFVRSTAGGSFPCGPETSRSEVR